MKVPVFVRKQDKDHSGTGEHVAMGYILVLVLRTGPLYYEANEQTAVLPPPLISSIYLY